MVLCLYIEKKVKEKKFYEGIIFYGMNKWKPKFKQCASFEDTWR